MHSVNCDSCGRYNQWPKLLRVEIKCQCGVVLQGANSYQWTKLIKWLRKPEDKGIGDTAKRIAAKFGGERFKAFAKRIGMPCGCTERQEEWNRIWPY